jgi:hypothetical protein
MQECDLLISLHQLKFKVEKLTQTCATPFKSGILEPHGGVGFSESTLKYPFT